MSQSLVFEFLLGEITVSIKDARFITPYFLLIGGIIGLGEAEEDRVGLLHTLATLPTHPESVPINALVPVKGTPLQDQKVVSLSLSSFHILQFFIFYYFFETIEPFDI